MEYIEMNKNEREKTLKLFDNYLYFSYIVENETNEEDE
jgi:hypothetical protein